MSTFMSEIPTDKILIGEKLINQRKKNQDTFTIYIYVIISLTDRPRVKILIGKMLINRRNLHKKKNQTFI